MSSILIYMLIVGYLTAFPTAMVFSILASEHARSNEFESKEAIENSESSIAHNNSQLHRENTWILLAKGIIWPVFILGWVKTINTGRMFP